MNRLITATKKILFDDGTDGQWWIMREKALNSKNKLKKLYYKYKYIHLMRKKNSNIPLETKIASQPTLPHGLSGIFISQGACIGKEVVIFQQVTIGSNTLRDSKNAGYPTIGDNCYIGTGAKIIGKCHIGKNVRIGANCVIVKDISENSTVVTPSPRVILHKNSRDNTFKTT